MATRSDAKKVPRKPHATERNVGEARFHAVIDNVLDEIITIDDAGVVLSFNPAAEAMFGYGTDEVAGQYIKMLMPEPFHGEHDGYVARYLEAGKARIIGMGREVTGRRKDGTVFPIDLAVTEMRVGSAGRESNLGEEP